MTLLDRSAGERIWAERALDINPDLRAAVGAITPARAFDDILGAVRQINHDAARLAEALAEPYPFATDETIEYVYAGLAEMWKAGHADCARRRRHHRLHEQGFDSDTLPLFEQWIDALEHLHGGTDD